MKKKVFALGFFDGVHLGHQALLGACVDMAQKLGAIPAAVTFDIHPASLVAGDATGLINTAQDRLGLLKSEGIQQVHTLHFDKKTMATPWQSFFAYLTRELGAVGLICGDDFRFGCNGEGTAKRLRSACEQAGIACTVVPEQTLKGIRVSSTHIRGLIQAGEMESAAEFLGHPHILSGEVISGRKLGRTIGVPTANLLLPEGVVAPKFGVYACRALVEGEKMPAVTNIGTRPTVGGHRVTVEPWILDFQGDLYGKQITLEFYKFLRPEQKFPSLEALQTRILQDAENTRSYFRN